MTPRHLLPAILMAALTAPLIASCDLEDICDGGDCGDGNYMLYRYTLDNTDYFDTYISSMSYFLFDYDGTYLGEMECADGDLSMVDLSDLSPGSYKLVALANLVDYGVLEGHTTTGLDDFLLRVTDLYEFEDSTTRSNIFATGDRLYWGQKDFTIVSGESNTYITQMANIYCRLTVRVEWENLPAYEDGYVYELEGIGSWVEQNLNNADTIKVQHFPKVHDFTSSMREDVPLRRFALQASLYTLRYTTRNIPTFRLLHEDETVTPDVDLYEVFITWGWYPSNAQVQDYEVLITINADGSVTVSQGLDSYISDWADGGTFS